MLKKGINSWDNENIIQNFCGIIGCNIKDKRKNGLDFLLYKYKDILDAYTQKLIDDEEKKSYSGIFYEDNEIKIYNPQTEKESCYYGKGTKWCTAGNRGNYFNQYNNNGPLYIIIPKHAKYAGEKYQYHQYDLSEKECMNELDNPIEIDTLLKMYPTIINSKIL